MLTLSIFDIPFLANAIRITASSVSPIDATLYELNGQPYLSGSYDTFKSYPDGECPTTNGGYGWASPWRCEDRLTYGKLLSADVLLDYSASMGYIAGTLVSGSDTGYGWDSAWNVIQGN